MTSLSRRIYQREWRKRNHAKVKQYYANWKRHPETKHCACGKPAATFDSHAFICSDCLKLQAKYEADRARRATCGFGSAMPVHVLHLAGL